MSEAMRSKPYRWSIPLQLKLFFYRTLNVMISSAFYCLTFVYVLNLHSHPLPSLKIYTRSSPSHVFCYGENILTRFVGDLKMSLWTTSFDSDDFFLGSIFNPISVTFRSNSTFPVRPKSCNRLPLDIKHPEIIIIYGAE